MWETWVRSLGWEDPLEKGTATHSNILACRIPWTSPWGRKESDTELLSLCPTLCIPMDYSTSGFPDFHHLLEFVETHVHPMVGVQSFHPLPFPFPPAFYLSQHQGRFQWVGSLHLNSLLEKFYDRCYNFFKIIIRTPLSFLLTSMNYPFLFKLRFL